VFGVGVDGVDAAPTATPAAPPSRPSGIASERPLALTSGCRGHREETDSCDGAAIELWWYTARRWPRAKTPTLHHQRVPCAVS
jgi:hypothetical protein